MASDDPTEHVTGYFVRIPRSTGYANVDIATLSDIELDAFLASQGPERAVTWAKALAKWIRDHVRKDTDPGNVFG